jgi:hypothetical protein
MAHSNTNKTSFLNYFDNPTLVYIHTKLLIYQYNLAIVLALFYGLIFITDLNIIMFQCLRKL